MNRTASRLLSAVVTCVAILGPMNAHAFRMVQNTSVGRTSFAAAVRCDDPTGFAHRNASSISWRLNTAHQGGKAGIASALQASMSGWTGVWPAGYTLALSGTTTSGFATDGVNTALWATGNGCTGGCLAITALVLGAGQVITEADISFNNAVTWNTSGGDYDVAAIAAHELGHAMGIHHTDYTKRRGRPTMYSYYFGTDGRSMESDDRDALNCAFARYPPTGAFAVAAVGATRPGGDAGPRMTTRPRPGGAILHFALGASEQVRLDVFDVAGRRLTTLVNEVRGAGDHEVAWDGAAEGGHAVSGVYFARLISSSGRASATVILTE